MKKLWLSSSMLFSCLLFISTNAQAFEVTYLEFNVIGHLELTVSTNSTKIILQCRAELDGHPIGSGSGLIQAGVAKVDIDIPEGLRNRSSEFKYFCVE